MSWSCSTGTNDLQNLIWLQILFVNGINVGGISMLLLKVARLDFEYIDSKNFRYFSFLFWCIIWVSFQLIRWDFFEMCWKIWEFGSLRTTLFLCSSILFATVRPVSPMYDSPQSLQGILYTTFGLSLAGMGSLRWVSYDLSVVGALQLRMILCYLSERFIISEAPFM